MSLALPALVLILSCAKVNNNNTLTENATLKFTVSGYKLLDMAKDGSWFAAVQTEVKSGNTQSQRSGLTLMQDQKRCRTGLVMAEKLPMMETISF